MYDGLKNLELPSKRKHPAARKIAKYSGILLLCMVVFFGVAGYSTYRYVQKKISDSHDLSIQVAKPLKGPQNILILGSDDRTGLTKKELKELHISRAGGKRSDTIILLRVTPGERAVLVSFPRDLLVDIPRLEGKSRINTAYAFGGPNRIIQTIKNLTGMKIHHYVEVSFVAFRDLVDAVGGVSLYVPKPLHDEQSGLDIAATGCVELKGTQALAFVRARKIYPNQDLGRIQAQQRFMRALLSKVKSPGTLLNLFKVRSIADTVPKGLKTSKYVNIDLARSLAGALSDFGTDGVDFRVIPSSTRAGSPYVYVNESEARAFFAALRSDKPLPPYGKTQQSKADPQDVEVEVFNGSGTDGLAGRENTRLRKLKFDSSVGGNARRTPKTIIKYAPDAQQKAALVAKYFPGADVSLGANIDADVAVILGPDAVTPGTTSPKPNTKPKAPQIGAACG